MPVTCEATVCVVQIFRCSWCDADVVEGREYSDVLALFEMHEEYAIAFACFLG